MKEELREHVDRRTILKSTGVGTVATLAGCSGGSAGGGGGGTTNSSGGTTQSGSNGGGSTSTSGSLTIAYIGPLQHNIGKAGLRGTKIAVDEINKNGGINGQQVTLLSGDTQFSPSQASTLVKKFVHSKDAQMIMGTFASEVMLGIEGLVGHTNIPFIDTGAASPEITQGHLGSNYTQFKNVFRVSPLNSDYEAKALGHYGKFLHDQHGWSKFAVVVEDATWTKPISNIVPQVLKQEGLDVVTTKRFSPKTNDFTPLLNHVKQAGAQVMLKAIAHVPGPGLLSTWRQNKYPFAQEGINVSSMSPSYWGDTNGGCQYETTDGPSGTATITKKTDPFVKKYKNAYSSHPTLPMYTGIGSRDAVYVYKNAVEAAGTADYKNHLDEIVAKLEATDMVGAEGHIKFFGKNKKYPHDVEYGPDKVPLVMDQWQKAKNGNGLAGSNGKLECVWPKKYATAKHEAPPWMS